MANRWNIPSEMERRVRNRDTACVYCHVKFENNPKDRATWEHIDNSAKNICDENITLCCSSCNASKSDKQLLEWFESQYCKQKGITKDSVAEVIKRWIIDKIGR